MNVVPEKLQQTAAQISFVTMDATMSAYQQLNIPVISTTRPLSFYRRILFDNQTVTQLEASLKGKTIVDIGCGLTPFVDDSMFQWCRRRNIDFYGVDPKVKDGFQFGLFDRLKSWGTGARTTPNPNIEGLDKTIATYADDLPFEDHSVDVILSCWLVMSWVRDEALLMKIFSEFDRVLKPGGVIKIFPTMHADQLKAKYPELMKLLGKYSLDQRFQMEMNLGSVPPAYCTTFRKDV